MHYYLKALPLALPLVLAACGVASPDNPAAVIPADQIAPTIESVVPGNNTEVETDAHQVTIKFSEPLDQSLVAALGNLKIEPALPNTRITYDSANNAAVITWDTTTLPYNQNYVITVSGALADLAGNKISGQTFTFRTPKAVTLTGEVQGLATGQKLVLVEKITNTQIEVSGANAVFDLGKLFPTGSPYSLAIATQPSNKDFCSVLRGSGTAGTQIIDLDIQCSKVLPVFASVPNWNDYIALDGGEDPLKSSGAACDYTKHDRCYHAGELRKSYVPDSLIKSDTTCSDLTARDHVGDGSGDGFFNWTCVDDVSDTAGRFKMVTTKLRDDFNLKNLMLADALTWRPSMVMFKNEKTNERVENLGAAPWWHNPIVEATNRILDKEGTVYVIRAKSGPEANIKSYQITADRIAAITTSGSLRPTATSTAIQAYSAAGYLSFLWLELDVDSSYTDTGLGLKNIRYSMVRNTTVSNAEKTGITVESVGRSKFHNVTAKNNLGTGIHVSGTSPLVEARGNAFSSITVAGNGFTTDTHAASAGHGIQVSTQYNKLHGIRAVSNKGDGIAIEDSLNTLTDIASYSNTGNGLHLNGASKSSVVGGTLAANGGAGLRLVKTDGIKAASSNLFANITSILNSGDGVAISDGGNSLIRVVSALNGGNGLQAGSAITNTAFVDNAVNGNGVNCSLLGATACPSGITLSSSDLTASFAIANATDSYLRDKVFEGFVVKASSTAKLKLQNVSETYGAGPCEAGCRELDLRLKTADTLALKKLALPTAAGDVESHTFSSTATEFLAHAHEVFGDRIGNDNGLCEVNETCVFNPNLGAYQGEGIDVEVLGDSGASKGDEDGVCELGETCKFVLLTDVPGTGTSKWEAMGITLKQYGKNGY